MEEKDNTNLVKTIVFVLTAALTALIFYGLGSETKTQIETVSFGFIMFTEVVVYLSTVLTKTNKADVISCAIVYTLASALINIVFKIATIRTLIVLNCAAIIIYLLLMTIFVLGKKK